MLSASKMNSSIMKRLFFLSLAIILVVGVGFFYYWWWSQVDVRELNKSLPEGVKVVKSFLGNEYKVVNKIDGYEFAIPKAWQGIEEIEYVPERKEQGYTAASISVEGEEGWYRIVTIDRFKEEALDVNLELWVKKSFETFGLVGSYFNKDKIGDFEVIKTQEEVHLMGMYVYFFKKDSAIYSITNGSEDYIREIILNGQW